jgi:hypothetical protein
MRASEVEEFAQIGRQGPTEGSPGLIRNPNRGGQLAGSVPGCDGNHDAATQSEE